MTAVTTGHGERAKLVLPRVWRWLRTPRGEIALILLALAISTWVVVALSHTADFDVPEYQQYARAFWFGQPRFTIFPAEYPPLTLLPFSLTLLPGFTDPRLAFALAMDVFFLGGYALLWRFCTRVAARRYALYLLLALQATLLDRFDLVPAVAVLTALLAARSKRYVLAYALLAVGILLKLYPLVLLPPLMIAQVRDRDNASNSEGSPGWRIPWSHVRRALAGAAFCSALVGIGVLLPALHNPSGALAFVTYGLRRPTQVESLGASLQWVGTLFGIPALHGYSFGSDTYTGPLSDPLSLALSLALPVALLVVYARQLMGKLSPERTFLVAVALVLLASKVFSTQYMAWILPLAAVVGDDTVLWLAICALTCADYPGLYPFNHVYVAWEEVSFMAVVALRNALLLLVAIRAVAGIPVRRAAGSGPADLDDAPGRDPVTAVAVSSRT